MELPDEGFETLDAQLERRGPLFSVVAGALALVAVWLIHPIMPGPGEYGFDEGMKLAVALAFAAMFAPVLVLEGLVALRRPPPAPPPAPGPARFASFDESLQRGRQWRRRLGFCLVGAAHAVVWLATI
jgi:hypothetical protein